MSSLLQMILEVCMALMDFTVEHCSSFSTKRTIMVLKKLARCSQIQTSGLNNSFNIHLKVRERASSGLS